MKTDRMKTDRMKTDRGRMAKETTAIPLPTKAIRPMMPIMAVRMAVRRQTVRTMPVMA